jgi:8-amino-7-oxononanoate synthase
VPATEGLNTRIADRLADLQASGLMRRLSPPAGIDLSSNDYLGLSSHPLLKQRMSEAVLREGCGSTGSRLLRGEREGFAAVERQFAAFKGTERALYFSSGYLANLAVLTAFPEHGDVIFSDERNHASIIDGIRLSRARRVVFPHNDVAELGRLMASEPGQKFVITESLFSMDGDIAPVADYASLCRSANAALIIDEAHTIGIYGDRGSGLIDEAGVSRDVFVSINTAGKAMGVSGAFVAGPASAIEYLIQRARPFIFSTAPPPAVADALQASLEIIRDEPDRRGRLRRRSRFLRECLIDAGIELPADTSHIIPILIGENTEALAIAQALQDEGFDVRAIRPPSVPAGTARLRISLNADLDEQTLSRFTATLAAIMQRFGKRLKSAISAI